MEWPKDNKPANFNNIIDPLYEVINFAYILHRQNKDIDIPWNGLDIGVDCNATSLLARERLTATALQYSELNQGRDALREILDLAIQLEIEQGRRLQLERQSTHTQLIQLALESINECFKKLS